MSNKITLRGAIGAISILVAFLSWVVPGGMLPFVNLLPYIQVESLPQRLIWSTIFHATSWGVFILVATPRQIKAVRERTLGTLKDWMVLCLGIVFTAYLSAALSANTFGLLVKIFPGEKFVHETVVMSARSTGSNFRAIEVQFTSLNDPRTYEITLSKRIFGDLPKLKPGDSLRLEGKENLFGSYVHGFAVIQSK